MDIGRERDLWYHRETIKTLTAPQRPSSPQRAEQEGMRNGQPTQLQRNGRLSAFREQHPVRARLPSSAAKGRAVPHLHLHRAQPTPVDTRNDLHPTVRRHDDEGSPCALGQP
jgi:hypothetical protein